MNKKEITIFIEYNKAKLIKYPYVASLAAMKLFVGNGVNKIKIF